MEQNNEKDKVLTCVDCGNRFTFRFGEQVYFLSKSLSTPKRCLQCRQIRRRTLIPINDHTCINCFHLLPNKRCSCRSPEDIELGSNTCQDWQSQEAR